MNHPNQRCSNDAISILQKHAMNPSSQTQARAVECLRSCEFKEKLKHRQRLCQLRGRCITITILHNTACLEMR